MLYTITFKNFIHSIKLFTNIPIFESLLTYVCKIDFVVLTGSRTFDVVIMSADWLFIS